MHGVLVNRLAPTVRPRNRAQRLRATRARSSMDMPTGPITMIRLGPMPPPPYNWVTSQLSQQPLSSFSPKTSGSACVGRFARPAALDCKSSARLAQPPSVRNVGTTSRQLALEARRHNRNRLRGLRQRLRLPCDAERRYRLTEDEQVVREPPRCPINLFSREARRHLRVEVYVQVE